MFINPPRLPDVSALLVDNVNFVAVPAPPQFLGTALAAAVGTFSRYRRQWAKTTQDKSKTGSAP